MIPDWNQEKIANAKVLILGVGAIGSYVATNLALTGVGTLHLVDFDTIEVSNLNRQLLFQFADVGKNKATVAQEKLQLLNPDIVIHAYPIAMEKLPKAAIKDIDLIMCCLDTFPGRRYANSLAVREKKVMILGGMYGFFGDVQIVHPYLTACFECQPLITQDKLSQACSPLGDTRIELEEVKKEPPLPSVSTLSSIIGGMMSQEALKYLLEIGEEINNYLFFDGLYNGFTQINLKKNDNCPMCGTAYKLEEQSVIGMPNESVKDFRYRIALAFGLARPTMILEGKILQDTDLVNFSNGTKIYITDERLAKPIVVVYKNTEKD